MILLRADATIKTISVILLAKISKEQSLKSMTICKSYKELFRDMYIDEKASWYSMEINTKASLHLTDFSVLLISTTCKLRLIS